MSDRVTITMLHADLEVETNDISIVKNKIDNLVMILGHFKALREPTISRARYVSLLLYNLSIYYGYSDYLMELLYHLFSVDELIEFLEASNLPRPVTIRSNSLKTRRRELAQILIDRGINVDPIEWSKVGLVVYDSSVPVGATPEYLAGHYMLQGAASFLPVMALDPRQHERILDMCSAPGGKTCFIAALMKNTGVLFANDIDRDRTQAICANIYRMGVKNVIVSALDGRMFPKTIGGFDRVLLDAPCSGTGIISKDPSVKVSKTEAEFKTLSRLQKELILSAIDSVNPHSSTGGYLVYSTCSVSVEENEQVINYALRKRPNLSIIDTGLEFGTPGFTSYRGTQFDRNMKLTKRYYPHTHNLDGFFVAKLRINPTK